MLSLIAVAGIGAVGLWVSNAAQAAVVSSIVVQGNTRIEAETVRNYVLIVPGKSFTNADIDESVKALYGTGPVLRRQYLHQRQPPGRRRRENRVVNSVIIQGNKKVKNDVSGQLLQTKPRGVLTEPSCRATSSG